MKNRELIEMLAKKNWDAEIRMDARLHVPQNVFCEGEGTYPIQSLSEFTSKGKSFITINKRPI